MESQDLSNTLNNMTEIFKALAIVFGELDVSVENKNIKEINKIVAKINSLVKDLDVLEVKRVELTKILCEKHKIKESAKTLAIELKDQKLTQALNSLIESINNLLIKRDYTMNVLRSHIDYLNFSIDYFKKLLSFGNYNEKGKTSKYINLLDKEG
jgi:hypothetical protein